MEFVVGFPRKPRKNYYIYVVVDRLTAHFIHIKSTYSAKDYATIYINEIVILNGILLFIKSNRGSQFTSHFLISFQKG